MPEYIDDPSDEYHNIKKPTPREDPEQKEGVTGKYTVRRTDRSTNPGGKHELCDFFVLDFHHDRFSYYAMKAYVAECRAEYPALAKDIDRKIEELRTRFNITEG